MPSVVSAVSRNQMFGEKRERRNPVASFDCLITRLMAGRGAGGRTRAA